MPIEVNIIMDLIGSDTRVFEPVISVDQGVYLRFVVRLRGQFLRRRDLQRSFSFSLYFEGKPPRGFKSQSNSEMDSGMLPRGLFESANTQSIDKQPYFDVIVGEGDATEPGRYKYGIRATSNDEELFDEDPVLIITLNGISY